MQFPHDLAELADLLGGTVHFDERDERRSYAYILLDGATDVSQGPGVFIRFGGWHAEGRIAIMGVWPHDVHGSSCLPSHVLPYGERDTYVKQITVAETRSVESVAADIKRRYLPTYRGYYAMCREYVDRRDGVIARQTSARDRLAEILPDARGVQSWNKHDACRYLRGGVHGCGPSVEVEISYNDPASVQELNLRNIPIDDAEWILRFLFERARDAAESPETARRG